MLQVFQAASKVDAGAVAATCETPEQIKVKVFEARLAAIKTVL
jgi:hypothetical protein